VSPLLFAGADRPNPSRRRPGALREE